MSGFLFVLVFTLLSSLILTIYVLSQHAGDLGNITAGPDGRATFRLIDKVIKVWDVIGRSVVVTDGIDDLGRGNHPRSSEDGNSGQRLVEFTQYFSFEESVFQNLSQ
jgi:hypothetical protein